MARHRPPHLPGPHLNRHSPRPGPPLRQRPLTPPTVHPRAATRVVGDGVGYLLKDQVVDAADFVAALRHVLGGGTVVDPQVIRQLIGRRRDPLASLSPREHEVLALIAEGHSNAAIARRLAVADATVGKHVRSIVTKLDLPQTDDTHHRRVLAVLTYLRGRPTDPGPTRPS
ncbi:response regulator transcription factor [Actinomadura sp. KC345]|nr:response regulator transcription factor [Actinomadura sp. KC345]